MNILVLANDYELIYNEYQQSFKYSLWLKCVQFFIFYFFRMGLKRNLRVF